MTTSASRTRIGLILLCAFFARSGVAEEPVANAEKAEQTAPEQRPRFADDKRDPKNVRVIVDDVGKVGFRIADAQQLVERIVIGLQKRIGYGTVVYEGLAKAAKDIKRRLGKGSETPIQDEQLAYHRAAAEHAKFRVALRFGKKRKGQNRHWLRLTCRTKDAPKGVFLETKTLRAKSFSKLRDKLETAIDDFCPLLNPPKKESPPKPRAEKKPAGPWKPPPLRR